MDNNQILVEKILGISFVLLLTVVNSLEELVLPSVFILDFSCLGDFAGCKLVTEMTLPSFFLDEITVF